MSASNEWEEWHLTPRGWVKGTEKFDFSPPQMEPRPDDTVATFVYRQKMSSAFSPIEHSWTKIWGNGEAVEPLIDEFGKYPEEAIQKFVEGD